MTKAQDFHPSNVASELLGKIGSGSADADFGRAIQAALDRSKQTGKSSKVVVTVEVKPRDDMGCVEMRASVEAKLPKLPAPATQMHVSPKGELLTQQEFMFGGVGRDERPAPMEKAPSSASGRHNLAVVPKPAPLADAPKPAPMIGKDAASGPT